MHAGVSARTSVAKIDELFGQQICQKLHDEQEILVLVLLSSHIESLTAQIVFGVDLQ